MFSFFSEESESSPKNSKKQSSNREHQHQQLATTDDVPLPVDLESTQIQSLPSALDETVVLAAEDADHDVEEGEGNVTVVTSIEDVRQIKFKKAKKFRKIASKHYMKHLNEGKGGRFKVKQFFHSFYKYFFYLFSFYYFSF
jgi:hypothetical protein